MYRRHYQSRRPEKDMTLEHIAVIITAHIIVLIILWARFSISSAHRACVFFNADVSKKLPTRVASIHSGRAFNSWCTQGGL